MNTQKKVPEHNLTADDEALERLVTAFLKERDHPGGGELLDILFERMKDDPTLLRKIGRFLRKEWNENKHHISVTLKDGELAIKVAGVYVFTKKLIK